MSSSKRHKKLPHEKHDWQSMTAKEVYVALGTSENGLSAELILARRKLYGSNRERSGDMGAYVDVVFRQFRSPLTLVLVFSSAITLLFHEYTDSLVILCAALVAVFVSSLQDCRALRAFEHSQRFEKRVSYVMRGGVLCEVQDHELVPGDVVMLHSGTEIPARSRIVHARGLILCDLEREIYIHGEAEASPDLKNKVGVTYTNMAEAGQCVTQGEGRAVVTEVPHVMVHEFVHAPTISSPIAGEMQKFSKLLFALITTFVTVLFIVGILRGESLYTMFLTSVAIAVASIPEGLPAAVAIVLALGVEALARRGGVVRTASDAEALGSLTYVIADVPDLYVHGSEKIVGVVYNEMYLETHEDMWSRCRGNQFVVHLLQVATRAINVPFHIPHSGTRPGLHVSAHDDAILAASHSLELINDENHVDESSTEYFPCTGKQYFACSIEHQHDSQYLSLIGLAEHILEASTTLRTAHAVRPMSHHARAYYHAQVAEAISKGYEVVAVATKHVVGGQRGEMDAGHLHGLEFLGLLIFETQIDPNIAQATKKIQSYGAHVRLVTEAPTSTALRVAQCLGICGEHDVPFTGRRLAHISDTELYKLAGKTAVFASMLPRHTLRLISVLEKHGEKVAFIGGSLRDVPLIEKASVGIAREGSVPLARKVSSLILIRGGLHVVFDAIVEGRRMIANLKKIVAYLISTSMGEAVLIGSALIIGTPIPLLPVQILWANIMEEGLMSLAFAFDPQGVEQKKRSSENIEEEGILSKDMIRFIIYTVSCLSLLLLVLYVCMLRIGISIEVMRSVMFLAISFNSLCITFAFRSLTKPFWRISLSGNRFFVCSFVLSGVMLISILIVPPLQKIFSYQPLPLEFMFAALSYGMCSLVAIEIGKKLMFGAHREA